MSHSMFETLETRQLLSISAPVAAAGTGVPAIAAMTVPAKAPTVYGSYVGTATVTEVGVKGTVVIQISRSGTKIVGRTYSSGLGGFDVSLTGKVVGRTATLAGRSTTAVIKRITATMSVDGRTISGSISMTQNGLPTAATFKLTRTATPPKPAAARAPNLLGNYRGAIKGDENRSITVSITRQSGGLFWGTSSGGALNGVVLPNGLLFLHIHEPDALTDADGQFSAGKITGQWGHQDNSGTFSVVRVSN